MDFADGTHWLQCVPNPGGLDWQMRSLWEWPRCWALMLPAEEAKSTKKTDQQKMNASGAWCISNHNSTLYPCRCCKLHKNSGSLDVGKRCEAEIWSTATVNSTNGVAGLYRDEQNKRSFGHVVAVCGNLLLMLVGPIVFLDEIQLKRNFLRQTKIALNWPRPTLRLYCGPYWNSFCQFLCSCVIDKWKCLSNQRSLGLNRHMICIYLHPCEHPDTADWMCVASLSLSLNCSWALVASQTQLAILVAEPQQAMRNLILAVWLKTSTGFRVSVQVIDSNIIIESWCHGVTWLYCTGSM